MKIHMCVLANITQCAYALKHCHLIHLYDFSCIKKGEGGNERRVGNLWLVCKMKERVN